MNLQWHPKNRVMPALGCILLLQAGASCFASAKVDDGHRFTRLIRRSNGKLELQTRVVRLIPANGVGPQIWLVGTAHIGQASYYKQIQELLDRQSLVMYEGVKSDANSAPVGTSSETKPSKAPFPSKDKSTFRLFAEAVGLDFQLYDIDYSRKTFVNCDLTWKEVTALSAKQGSETATKVAGIGKLLDSGSSEGGMFALFLKQIKADPASQEAMRVVLAEALSRPTLMDTFLGERASDVLIKSRNSKVLGELDTHSSEKSIAIFFGAAHMPDMEARLERDKKYREAEEKWLPAISADESKVTGAGSLILTQFRMLIAPPKH